MCQGQKCLKVADPREEIFSFHECLLDTYYVPGTALELWDTAVKAIDKNLCPLGESVLAGREK